MPNVGMKNIGVQFMVTNSELAREGQYWGTGSEDEGGQCPFDVFDG
jgi:hypothetical protein